jgi:hypothetical protein
VSRKDLKFSMSNTVCGEISFFCSGIYVRLPFFFEKCFNLKQGTRVVD